MTQSLDQTETEIAWKQRLVRICSEDTILSLFRQNIFSFLKYFIRIGTVTPFFLFEETAREEIFTPVYFLYFPLRARSS